MQRVNYMSGSIVAVKLFKEDIYKLIGVASTVATIAFHM